MKTYIFYLAAGNSRRFGSQKLLHTYNGKELYRHTLDVLKQTQYEIIVVTQHQEIYDAMLKDSHIKVIRSENSHLGMSYTIRAGLQFIKDVERPFQMVFVVADQPHLKLSTVESLIHECISHHALLGTIVCNHQPCNPTLFHSDYYDELMNLSDDQGGRVILRKYSNSVYKVYRDDMQEFVDIDYKEDVH